MKNLKNLKNHKNYEKLVNKSNGVGRMPQLRLVSILLNELNIEHDYYDWSEHKQTKSDGLKYYVSGGSKEYNGGRLRIKEINLNICSTETYYSDNTWMYSKEILNHINEKLNN